MTAKFTIGDKVFEGRVDVNRSRIRGKWHFEDDLENKYFFDFQLGEKVEGDMTITFGKNPPITEKIFMDYRKKRITSFEDKNLQIDAVEAVEQAELKYFILQPDVQYVDTN